MVIGKMFITCCFVTTILLGSLDAAVIADSQTNSKNVPSFNESKVSISMIFNITDNAERYVAFIRNMRTVLARSFSNGIPILRPQPSPQTPASMNWLDIRLVVNARTSITVRLEQSNLYVHGYARNDETTFWEFQEENTSSLIPQSQSLRFSGSYTKGLLRTANMTRMEILLGFYALQSAVIGLAGNDDPTARPTLPARYMVIIIQMFAEAARFDRISTFISVNWLTQRPITGRIEALENGWSRLSTAVQFTNQTTATPDTLLPTISPNATVAVTTLRDALAVFGIMLFHRDRDARSLSTIFAASDQAVSTTVADTRRVLMNLEYVRVNNIDGENPGDLFGTVVVDDGWDNYTLYDRSSSNTESKGPAGLATLTGPSSAAAISGEDTFVIRVSLWDYDSSSPNDEIAQGEIVWDPMVEDVTSVNYDKHLQQVVKGQYGNVTVGYSVISEALSVVIDVVLINGDGENPADVYGTVKASQVLGGSVGAAAMTLFERTSKQSVAVKPQQSIPLIRKVVGASVNSPLKITADLWDYDTTSSDDPIGQGSVDFTVKTGTQKSNINGTYGQVQVSITCQ